MNKELCISKIAAELPPVYVDENGGFLPEIGEGHKVVGKDGFSPKKNSGKKEDFTPLLTAGGVGLLAHYLASNILGDDHENKNKSTWYKLLAKLLPIGAAGLGAWGGYALGKKAQANDAKKSEPVKKTPVRDLRKEYQDVDYSPWGRWLTAGGFGTLGAGSAAYAGKNLVDLYKAPRSIPKLSPEQIAQNMETIRRINEVDIPYARSGELANANMRASAEVVAQDLANAYGRIQPNQKGTPKEIAANLKALQDADDVVRRNAPYTGKSVADLEGMRSSLETANIEKMTNPNWIGSNGWKFWKNPKIRRVGGGILGTIAAAIPAAVSAGSAMKHNSEREAARQRYEAGRKAIYGE